MDQNAARHTPSMIDLPMAESRTPAYDILREAGPVTVSRYGTFTIVSSEAAEFAFKNPELFSSRRAFDGVGSPLPLVPIAFDPPEHTRYRRILQPFFSPRGIASWELSVRALAGQLIDGVASRGHCDLVAELAVPLPAQVFLTLFGLPLEDLDRLTAWKDRLLHSFSPPIDPTRDVTLAGQLIPAGARVNIALAVASRDPAEHPDPDAINLRRADRHLAFGAGPHRCLGSHLARMELRATMQEWHRRIPEYELAPAVTPRVTWPNSVVSVPSLPLVFPPGPAGPVA